MRDSTELPDLRVLDSYSLVPHEDTDPRRIKRLSERILAEGKLKNPPVVAPIPDTNLFVVLDGANRVGAFQLLNIPHIVAQLVTYDSQSVELDTWYHVVSGMAMEDFEHALTQVTGLVLRESTLEEARNLLKEGIAAAYIIRENLVRIVVSPEGKLLNDIHLLKKIVAAYKGRADIFRASNDVWDLQYPYYPQITALVVFPKYKPEDIIQVAANGDKVPSGVTRHIIQHRALNINIPLNVLQADWSLERKEKWLYEWLMQKMAANSIRYYSESTFSFDE